MSAPELEFTESSNADWLAFLASQPDVNIFQHPAWSQMLQEAYEMRPFVIILRDATGHILAGLPVMEICRFLSGTRWVSLPFSDHCAPISVSPAALCSLTALLDAKTRAREIPQLEVRGAQTQASGEYVLTRLQLDSNPENLCRGIHHTHLRNIRRAESHHLDVRHGTEQEDIRSFYQLHLQTRRKQGVPIQPYRYFELLCERLIKQGLGFVSLVYAGKKCLAGAVFLHWQGTLTYKYGASIVDSLDCRPNHLLFWDAIQWGCLNGFSNLDFGRSDISNTGLRVFKARWGGVETPLSYSHFPLNLSHPAQPSLIMPVIRAVIRSAPAQICTLGGEFYYRHIA